MPALRPDPSPHVEDAIAKIRKQLDVNLEYFSGNDRETLAILQGHIKDQLQEIELILALTN